MVGVPMVAMAALGVWAPSRRRHERLAILLVASALLPLAIFAVFNTLGKDAHTRYTFVALFAWLALPAVGIELMVEEPVGCAGAPRPLGCPSASLLSTYAVADYMYMTGGAGYRGR